MDRQRAPLVIGRYAIYDEVAAGGMATVHFGRLLGPVGFSRTVAVKRLHPTYARDPEFVAMFLDEARVCGRVRHPNVVSMLDVVATQGELFLVMDYVLGDSLARLSRSARRLGEAMPLPVVSNILGGVLHGLHAAHEARGERGEPLDIVHRDVSPQNVLVGVDGLARVVDFGVAKATGRLQSSRDGQIKGKIAYMSPEQLRSVPIDRRTDVYAAAVVLWEVLAGRRLFESESEGGMVGKILEEPIAPPSTYAGPLPAGLDALVMRGLERRRERRFQSAREMALALETCVRPALTSEVSTWVERVAGEVVHARARRVSEIESASSSNSVDVVAAVAATRTDLDVPIVANASREPPPSKDASQLSSISVTFGPPERPHRRGWVFAAAAVLLLGLLVGTGLAWRRVRLEPVPIAPAVAAPASSSVAIALPSASATASTTVIDPSASASASAATVHAPALKKVVKPSAVAPKSTAKPPPGAGGKPSNCYTVDGSGIWHIKPECL